MKKITSLLLALILVFTSLTPVFGAEAQSSAISLKQAIEIAKDKLQIATEGYEFTSNYSEDRNGKTSWYLNWTSKTSESHYISATVDANTGDITYFNEYSPTYDTSRIPKYSREQAQKKADEFASKLQPDKFKQTKLLEQNNLYMYGNIYPSDTYSFNYIRYINNLPCQDNRIELNINKNSLEVTSYSFTWDTLAFPEPAKAITLERAKEIFEEKLGIEASYHLIYPDANKAPSTILVYSLKDGSYPIDALTGEILPYYSNVPYYGVRDELQKNTKQQDLTPEEQQSVEQNENLLKKDAAIAVLEKYVAIDSKYNLVSSNLNTGYPKGENPVWYFYWNYEDVENYKYGYIDGSVDAVTGEIKSFGINGSEFEPANKGATPQYTKEKAKKIAENFAKKIQPEKFASTEYRITNYELTESNETPTYYSFNFIRKANGVTCPFNSITITVHAYTGRVTNYTLNWLNNISLAEPENLIGIEEAYDKLYNKLDFSQKYIKARNYKEASSTPEIKLVYMLDNSQPAIIDAKTGEFLDNNGNPVKDLEKPDFADIKGHWAENDINLLAELGILKQEDDKFMPNDNIKQKDFIKLLIESEGPVYGITSVTNDVYEKYYEQAIQRKIIFSDEKSPDSNITRLQAAKFLVRSMNLGYIADLKNIYTPTFKDIEGKDNKNLGYVSIVSGLNIINGYNQEISPDRSLSRAESAVIIVRLLKVDKANKK